MYAPMNATCRQYRLADLVVLRTMQHPVLLAAVGDQAARGTLYHLCFSLANVANVGVEEAVVIFDRRLQQLRRRAF